VASGAPKEAQVQSYSPGGTIVPSFEGSLAQPGEYDTNTNTSVCCGDAALCHITLTACFYSDTNASGENI